MPSTTHYYLSRSQRTRLVHKAASDESKVFWVLTFVNCHDKDASTTALNSVETGVNSTSINTAGRLTGASGMSRQACKPCAPVHQGTLPLTFVYNDESGYACVCACLACCAEMRAWLPMHMHAMTSKLNLKKRANITTRRKGPLGANVDTHPLMCRKMFDREQELCMVILTLPCAGDIRHPCIHRAVVLVLSENYKRKYMQYAQPNDDNPSAVLVLQLGPLGMSRVLCCESRMRPCEGACCKPWCRSRCCPLRFKHAWHLFEHLGDARMHHALRSRPKHILAARHRGFPCHTTRHTAIAC